MVTKCTHSQGHEDRMQASRFSHVRHPYHLNRTTLLPPCLLRRTSRRGQTYARAEGACGGDAANSKHARDLPSCTCTNVWLVLLWPNPFALAVNPLLMLNWGKWPFKTTALNSYHLYLILQILWAFNVCENNVFTLSLLITAFVTLHSIRKWILITTCLPEQYIFKVKCNMAWLWLFAFLHWSTWIQCSSHISSCSILIYLQLCCQFYTTFGLQLTVGSRPRKYERNIFQSVYYFTLLTDLLSSPICMYIGIMLLLYKWFNTNVLSHILWSRQYIYTERQKFLWHWIKFKAK